MCTEQTRWETQFSKKVPKNVYSSDCDDVNIIYDFPAGHAYFLDDVKKFKKTKNLFPE
jgi:hypothetical protein